jgi:hypothetical protein
MIAGKCWSPSLAFLGLMLAMGFMKQSVLNAKASSIDSFVEGQTNINTNDYRTNRLK